MLTTEQRNKMAGFLYDRVRDDKNNAISVFDTVSESWILFRPSFEEIFKAMVCECKKRDFDIVFRNGWIVIEEDHNIPDYGPEEHFSELFDNESICLAYLAVMESI